MGPRPHREVFGQFIMKDSNTINNGICLQHMQIIMQVSSFSNSSLHLNFYMYIMAISIYIYIYIYIYSKNCVCLFTNEP